MEEKLERLQKKALSLPMLPGVYIMRNKQKEIIYIGKAKALKNRVSSYFASQDNLWIKVKQMVSNVHDFDYIICDSEFEALVLECSLIKQYMPKYNILLKDDKGYNYISISNDEYPILKAVKQMPENEKVLGPYYSSYYLNQALSEAKKIYKLPLCNKKFSSKPSKNVRPCLNHFIGLCSAPCAGKISKKEYIESVNGAVDFLKKGSKETLKALKAEMEQCSVNLEFEKAAKLRDRIIAIEKLTEKQKVVMSRFKDQDVIAFVNGDKKDCFEVFRFKNYKLCDDEHFFVEDIAEAQQKRAQFITQYYSIREDIPKRIVVDGVVEDKAEIEKMLSEKAGFLVEIVTAQKGEQKKLVDMCRLNAAERVSKIDGLSIRDTKVLDELQMLLGLKTLPKYIEAYDISNTAGTDNVAGMIVFKDGVPYKKAYKRFAIKTFEGQDDYGSMREVLSRRFANYEKHKGEEGFGVLPDLILLDGGMGQLNAVLPIVEKYDFVDKT
ncbi:MAG: excinuclease ABC subunit C, partial [Clostridia bacterium]|nr:excinuclease ABC subunit C [Clostridia bacterium]